MKQHFLLSFQHTSEITRTIDIYKELQKKYNSYNISNVKIDGIQTDCQNLGVAGDRRLRYSIARGYTHISSASSIVAYSTISSRFFTYIGNYLSNEITGNPVIFNLPMINFNFAKNDTMDFDIDGAEVGDYIKAIFIGGSFDYKEKKK